MFQSGQDVKARILVIDDDVAVRTTIAFGLRDEGYQVIEAKSAEEGLRLASEMPISVVISDIRLEGMSGIELLEKIKENKKGIEVLLITAYGTIEDAVRAMRSGAYTYLTKPVNMNQLELIIQRIMEKSRLLEEMHHLKQQLKETKKFDRIIGNHPRMQEIYKVIEQVAPSTANILIYGESGTGKELIGEAIHAMSSRSDGPFVKVNCAVFSETLLESELFGHEKGSFTGAYSKREGRFELAHGGTLFLDDVNVMPEITQAKILRFLQEREFERVGGTKTIKVDVRVIAATNTPLEDEVKQGNFREDLYYRLNVIPINLPPLRERRTDIPLLIGHFIEKYAMKNNVPPSEMNDPALSLVMAHDWAGNVRELENIIERAVIMARGEVIEAKHLPKLSGEKTEKSGMGDLVGRPLLDIEREAILRTLHSVDWNTEKAAKLLRTSRRKIQYKLKEYRKQASFFGIDEKDLLKLISQNEQSSPEQ